MPLTARHADSPRTLSHHVPRHPPSCKRETELVNNSADAQKGKSCSLLLGQAGRANGRKRL